LISFGFNPRERKFKRFLPKKKFNEEKNEREKVTVNFVNNNTFITAKQAVAPIFFSKKFIQAD
jgi:hypothetical protein